MDDLISRQAAIEAVNSLTYPSFARVLQDERFKKKSHDFPKWLIVCMGCGVRTPIAEMSTVVKIWNRRVTE